MAPLLSLLTIGHRGRAQTRSGMGNRLGRAGRVDDSPGEQRRGAETPADSSSSPQLQQRPPQQQQSVVDPPTADGREEMASSWQQQQKELHQQQRELEQQQQRRLREQLAAARAGGGAPVPPSTPSPRQPPSPAGVRIVEAKADVWKPPGAVARAPPQQPSPQFQKKHVQFQAVPSFPSQEPYRPQPSPSPKPYRPPQAQYEPQPQWYSTTPAQASPRSQAHLPQQQQHSPLVQVTVQQQQQPTMMITTTPTSIPTASGAPSPRRVPLDVVPQPSGQRVWSEEPICEYVEPGGPSLAQQIAQQSQDYVDEKELEYRLAIQQLQSECSFACLLLVRQGCRCRGEW
ncbi:hypothetical protein V5799_008978 [Amblyomma americanum]|uniref:Uncharacterized protein n=1 Tax=Amblyomma americanum TaxID=6943 RepID=A0AAQ4FBX8_AMBAM